MQCLTYFTVKPSHWSASALLLSQLFVSPPRQSLGYMPSTAVVYAADSDGFSRRKAPLGNCYLRNASPATMTWGCAQAIAL